jgi:hypothetical protein
MRGPYKTRSRAPRKKLLGGEMRTSAA